MLASCKTLAITYGCSSIDIAAGKRLWITCVASRVALSPLAAPAAKGTGAAPRQAPSSSTLLALQSSTPQRWTHRSPRRP